MMYMQGYSLQHYLEQHKIKHNPNVQQLQTSKIDYIMFTQQNELPGSTVVKNLSVNAQDARDAGLIPVSGKSPGEGNGNPLHYSCLENPTDKEAWQATVHGVAKSQA